MSQPIEVHVYRDEFEALSAEQQLAVRTLQDAVEGEDVTWPAEHAEGWRIIEHAALQVPGTRIVVELANGRRLTTEVPS